MNKTKFLSFLSLYNEKSYHNAFSEYPAISRSFILLWIYDIKLRIMLSADIQQSKPKTKIPALPIY